MNKTKFLFVVFATLSIGPLAEAAIIYGTGQGGSPNTRDSNWRIVAVPSNFTPPSSQTPPYDSYIIPSAPGVFIGGGNPQIGVTFNGVTNYWIAPHNTDASLVGGNYNWIVAQEFHVDTAGVYTFNFQGAGDNELDFYINGSITNYLGDSTRPTITGGTQIGTRAGGYGYLTTFTGNAFMNTGTNTAYMVLWDYGGSTGALIQQSTFASAVPEPGQVAASLLLLSGIGAYVRVKRRKAASLTVDAG